jgi:hypothetical protein
MRRRHEIDRFHQRSSPAPRELRGRGEERRGSLDEGAAAPGRCRCRADRRDTEKHRCITGRIESDGHGRGGCGALYTRERTEGERVQHPYSRGLADRGRNFPRRSHRSRRSRPVDRREARFRREKGRGRQCDDSLASRCALLRHEKISRRADGPFPAGKHLPGHDGVPLDVRRTVHLERGVPLCPPAGI